MGREIKFRGIKEGGCDFLFFNLSNYVSKDDGNEPPLFLQYKLKPQTVGQFTGLKDKNGVDIYEGDIIKATHYNFSYPDTIKTQLVYFDNACFCVKSIGNEVINPIQEDRNNVPLFWLQAPSSIEVIGNIHENPELIKYEN